MEEMSNLRKVGSGKWEMKKAKVACKRPKNLIQ
jgi:hypothetical protein